MSEPWEDFAEEGGGVVVEEGQPWLDFQTPEVVARGEELRREMADVAGQDPFSRWVARTPTVIPTPLIPQGQPGSIESVLGESTVGRFVSGAARGVEAAILGMGAPENIPLAPLALVPGVAPAMGIYFGGQAIGTGAGELSVARTAEEAGASIGQIGLGTLMAGAPVVKSVRPILRRPTAPAVVIQPETATGVAAPSVEVLNAIRQQKAEEVYGNVPEQPGVLPGRVPSEEGVGGVPSGGVRPSGGAPGGVGTEATRGPEVLVGLATRPPAELFEPTPSLKMAEELVALPDDQFVAWSNQLQGKTSQTRVSYNIGEALKSRAELTRIKELADKITDQGNEFIAKWSEAAKRGDPEAVIKRLEENMNAQGVKHQFLEEIYERATNTGSAKHYAEVYEPDYKPPFAEVPTPVVPAAAKVAAAPTVLAPEIGPTAESIAQKVAKGDTKLTSGERVVLANMDDVANTAYRKRLTELRAMLAKTVEISQPKTISTAPTPVAAKAAPAPAPPKSAATKPLETTGVPQLVGSSIDGDIVRLSFDATGRVPTREELLSVLKQTGHEGEVYVIEATPMSVARGEISYKVQLYSVGETPADFLRESKDFHQKVTGGDTPVKVPSKIMREVSPEHRFRSSFEAFARYWRKGEEPPTAPPAEVKVAPAIADPYAPFSQVESEALGGDPIAPIGDRPLPHQLAILRKLGMRGPAPSEAGIGSLGPGLGGAAYGERASMPGKPGGPSIVQQERQSAKMEGKVKLSAQYSLEKLEEQFNLFSQEIGDSMTTGGQFLPKELRPDIAKGKPAEPGTLVSRSVQQYFLSKLATLHRETQRVRSQIAVQSTPELLEYYDMIHTREKVAFRQTQELRRTASESLSFWNKLNAEFKDIAVSLRMFGELEAKKPILDQFWKDVRSKEWKRAGKDAVEFARVNLFTLGSWTLDFLTNATVGATHLPIFAINDAISLVRGKPAYEMAAALTALRRNARNLVPLVNKFRLPDEIEVGLGTTAGAEFAGFGKEVMVDFSEILKNDLQLASKLKEIDRLVAAPVRMKRGIDNFFGRLGASTELYYQGYHAAKELGLKGEDFRTAVENFVQAPTPEAMDLAVTKGKEWKFNRDLTEFEESFSRNIITKLALEAYPRWTFQFTRWAGEMLGADPVLYRKIASKTATQRDIVSGLVKAATGWGGIIAFNQLFYNNIDPNTMEYVKEDGDRVRLSGRTPAPELFFIVSILRGDLKNAKAVLPYTSLPLAKFLGGEPGGVASPVVDVMRESWKGNYTIERTAMELTRSVNNLIPGKSVLGFMRALYDPTIREGLGAPIPGVSSLLPQKINPTTGEPAAPMQKIPGTNFKFPTVGGTPFPGAVRDLNAIEAVLLNHGISTVRPRRTSLIELPVTDVPADLRREYERLAGQNVQRIVGQGITYDEFWNIPVDIRRKVLQKWLSIARLEARVTLAGKYGKRVKPIEQMPQTLEMVPEQIKNRPRPTGKSNP